MKMQNLHAMAEDMVRACLPYIDMRRQSSYVLHNRTITGPPKGSMSRQVQLRAKVGGREYITARCFMQSERLGQCEIVSEHSGTRTCFICQVSHGETLVMPMQGPDSCNERSLGISEKHSLDHYLGAAWSDWSIWFTGSKVAAYRQSWLSGEPLEADSIKSLSGAIARYELESDKAEKHQRHSREAKKLRATAKIGA
jgi:hypothetical protein